MDTYLVTGGAGFIGSNIVHALVEQGHSVRVLDNFSTGRRESLARLLERIEVIEGDITCPETVRQAAQGATYVLHHAAQVSVPASVADPAHTNRVNVEGTLNVLVAAREAGVRRVVCASSSAVYGNSPELPRREDMRLTPASPYAVTKVSAELYAQMFANLYGLDSVVLRYFNVFGIHQDSTSGYAAVIPKFITALAKGNSPTIYGDGRQTRDFIYVSDVVAANLKAATTPGLSGQIINIGSGEPHTILEVARLLGETMGTRLPPRHTQPRPGDVRHSHADISKARSLLCYEPTVSFVEGLRLTVAWLQQSTPP